MRSGRLWRRTWRYVVKMQRNESILSERIQRAALYREDGQPVAYDAARFAALAGGLSADATLDGGRMFSNHGRGSAHAAA